RTRRCARWSSSRSCRSPRRASCCVACSSSASAPRRVASLAVAARTPGRTAMPEPSKLGLFVVTSPLVLAMPGPAVLYIVSRGVAQGRTAGMVSVLGISAGNLVQVSAAALGLSALLLSSPLAFNVVRYLGAAYLVFLGLRSMVAETAGHKGNAFELR